MIGLSITLTEKSEATHKTLIRVNHKQLIKKRQDGQQIFIHSAVLMRFTLSRFNTE